MHHQIVVMLFTAQVAFASGQGDEKLKTSCLLQHQVLRSQPLQLSDEAADVGAHAEYLRSALVMVKELASNVTKWDTNISKSEREALQLIKDFINDLKKSAIDSHDEDQREVNRAKELIEDCARVANDALTGDVYQAKTTMQGSRRDHSACRTSEADCQIKENDLCGKWDVYRKSNSPNACAGVDFKDDMKSDVPATRDAMEMCLRELQPFYLQYVECWKYGECVKKIAPFCDSNQTKFERDFCSYSRQLSGTCDDQTDCRQQHISFRNATHKDVAANEAARIADYITSQTILCFFKVFEGNNTNKTAILRGCEKLAVNTSQLNISYPAIPGAQVCVVEPSQPCDNDWVSTEYNAKPWKEHVTMQDCEPCPTPTSPPKAFVVVASEAPKQEGLLSIAGLSSLHDLWAGAGTQIRIKWEEGGTPFNIKFRSPENPFVGRPTRQFNKSREANDLFELLDFETNAPNLAKWVEDAGGAYLCMANAGGFDTAWAVVPKDNQYWGIGCNSGGWQGKGAYYGEDTYWAGWVGVKDHREPKAAKSLTLGMELAVAVPR